MRNGTQIEFQNFSNLDDSIISSEEFSNFRFLGIGKPTKKQLERQAKRKQVRAENKEERKHMNLGQKLLNLSQKFNPAAAVPRSSALVGVRFNVFGIATRLYPAFLSDAELKARNFDLNNAKKARDAWEKVKKVWIGLGGGTASLKKAIMNGYDKPIFKTKKAKARKEKEKQGKFDGDDFMYSDYTGAEEAAAYISIGLALLGAVSGAIGKAGASKNPYAEGTPEAQKYNASLSEAGSDAQAPPVTPEQQAEVNKIADAARKDAAEGKGLDETGEKAMDESSDSENGDGKILGMSKPVFWTVTGIVAAAAIGFTIWKLKKKK